MNRRRRSPRVAVPLAAVFAVASWVASPDLALAAAPNFELPFQCGARYFAVSQPGHDPALDFNQANNADAGDPVLASAPGTVDTSQVAANGQVTILHSGGYRSVYAHMSGVAVTNGESVVTGEFLGFIDDVGIAFGEHLHYQQNSGTTIVTSRFDGTPYVYGSSPASSNYCVPAGTAPFVDTFDSSFRSDIQWAFGQDITAGCHASGILYCPTATVTREQMAAFLDRFLDLLPTTTDFFTDDESSPFEASINRVAAAGITGGCTATTFCPRNAVTREQMAAFLDRSLDLPSTSNDYFTDDESSPFEGAINRLAAASITGGCTATTYCPNGVVTREQMAAYLHRAAPYRP